MPEVSTIRVSGWVQEESSVPGDASLSHLLTEVVPTLLNLTAAKRLDLLRKFFDFSFLNRECRYEDLLTGRNA